MTLRLNIDQITPDTPDWTCKVQIVDISRERQSQEKKIKFQNLILEDEEEQQIWAVVYGDDIGYYAAKLTLFNTYLISTARVKVYPAKYGRSIHKFCWVIDKETIVEHVKPTAELEKALPTPTKLNITAFNRITHMTPAPTAEIDFIGVVLHCGPTKYAGRTQTRCREVTVTDDRQNQFLLTLWDDFGEVEGTELEAKLKKDEEFPVILGRNIGISPYQGLSLQTRFNSTICINSTYPQALELLNWAKTNKHLLSDCMLGSLAGSSATLAMTPAAHSVISIAEIAAQTSVVVFYIDAEMLITDDLQKFCVLECSDCKQKKHTKDKRQFDCTKCQKKTTLVPRCTFQIDLIDGSGSTSALISGNLAEKLLSMTADDIFQTTCIKMLSNRLFRIQLRKSSWIGSNVAQPNLTIMSYIEKEHVSPLIGNERNTKKAKAQGKIEVEMKGAMAENETSTSGLTIEPSTPAKKL